MTRTTHSYRRRIAFAEADPAGVVHFTRLLQFVEEAEHDWMREHGVDVLTPGTGWPRVSMQVDFKSPARFGDEVVVELSISKAGRTSLTWSFRIVMALDQRLVAEGTMTTCHVSRTGPDGQWSPAELPLIFRAGL